MNARGVVKFVNERNWNGKMLYSFRLDNDESLYMCGESRFPARRGDYVTFEYKEGRGGRIDVDVKSIEVKEAEVVEVNKSNFRPTQNTAYQASQDKRQETIEYQAARNSAIAAVGVILQANAVKLPAKEADKYGVVVGLISDLTLRFFEETKTLGAKTAPAETQKEKAPRAKKEEVVVEGDKSDADEDWE